MVEHLAKAYSEKSISLIMNLLLLLLFKPQLYVEIRQSEKEKKNRAQWFLLYLVYFY